MASENDGKRETLADIAAEIRAYGDRPPPKCAWLDIAERIEAIDSADAWRSLYTPQVGNAAAMREALNDIVGIAKIALSVNCVGNSNCSELWSIIDKCKSALSEPPRQCDVGTAEDQAERFVKHCQSFLNRDGIKACAGCPCCGVVMYGKCELAWAQMPCEKEGAGE